MLNVSHSLSLSLFLLFSVLSCIMFHCWEFFMPSSVFSIFHFVFDCDIVQFLCCYNKIEWVELQPIQSQPTFMPINCVAQGWLKVSPTWAKEDVPSQSLIKIEHPPATLQKVFVRDSPLPLLARPFLVSERDTPPLWLCLGNKLT